MLSIVHQPDAGPGVFAEAIAGAGWQMDTWSVAEEPDPPAEPLGYEAVLCLGGAAHPDEDSARPYLAVEREVLRRLIEAEVPLLGVCLGAQLLTLAAGGSVRRMPRPEIGWEPVTLTPGGEGDPVLAPLAPSFEAFEWHSYECVPPPAAETLADSGAGCAQAFSIGRAHAIQFHAEVSAADARHWIEDYRSDPDAVAIGLDAEALREETAAKIGSFNELGRELCGRWLELAA